MGGLGSSGKRTRTRKFVDTCWELDANHLSARGCLEPGQFSTCPLVLGNGGVVALNLYLSPNTLVRILTIGLGAVAFVSAIEGLRMYLVADRDGVGFRGLLRTHNVDWPDIQSISVRRSGFNGPTLRITRADGSYADVPPSLMLPTKPTGTAHGRMG